MVDSAQDLLRNGKYLGTRASFHLGQVKSGTFGFVHFDLMGHIGTFK